MTPKLIAEELYDRASVTYQFLSTLLRKVNDKDDALQKRIGIATAVIMNLMSQKMSVYATKLGVTLVASGKTKPCYMPGTLCKGDLRLGNPV